MLIGLCGALLVVGLVMVIVGIRGRRIDDHPLCRGCRFDLVGLYPPATCCPECGGSLESGSVRVGNRAKRRPFINFGVVILLCGLTIGGASAWGRAAKFNWNTVKPVWMLVWQGDSTDAMTADAALAELNARFTKDKLSDADIHRIVERCLERQADSVRDWRVGWGDFVDGAMAAGKLADEQVKRYARHCVVTEFEARPRVRRGDVLPAAITLRARAGTSTRLEIVGRHVGMKLGSQFLGPGITKVSMNLGAAGVSRSLIRIPLPPLKRGTSYSHTQAVAVPSGHYEVESRWIFNVCAASPTPGGWSYEGAWRETSSSEWPDDPQWSAQPETEVVHFKRNTLSVPPVRTDTDVAPISIFRAKMSVPVDVLPESADSVDLVTDSETQARVQRAISLNLQAVYPEGAAYRVMGNISVADDCPTDVAFDVVCRCGDGEQVIGCVAGSPGHSNLDDLSFQGKMDQIDLSQATMELRPSRDTARLTTSVLRVWDKPIDVGNADLKRFVPLVGQMRGQLSPSTVTGLESFRVAAEFGVRADASFNASDPVFRCAAIKPPYVYVMERGGTLYIFKIPDGAIFRRVSDPVVVPKVGDGNSVAVVGNTLVCGWGGTLVGYSLEDPLKPKRISKAGMRGGSAAQLVVRGTTAFLVQNDMILTFDISDPKAIRCTGTYETEGYEGSGCLVGNLLCIGEDRLEHGKTQGIAVYDASQPADLQRIGFVSTKTPPYLLFASGKDRVIVSLDLEPRGAARGSLPGYASIIDVSDPRNPKETFTTGGTGGRSGALMNRSGKDYLVCENGVWLADRDRLTPVFTFTSMGHTMDGAAYAGDSRDNRAVIVMDNVVLLIEKKLE